MKDIERLLAFKDKRLALELAFQDGVIYAYEKIMKDFMPHIHREENAGTSN